MLEVMEVKDRPRLADEAVLDELPRPVLTTVGPFVTSGDAELRSAKEGTDEVELTRPAWTVLEIGQEHVGKLSLLDVRDGDAVSVDC